MGRNVWSHFSVTQESRGGGGGGGEGQYVRAGAGSKGSLLRLSRTAAESRNPETGAPRFSSQLRDTSLDLSLSVFSTVK